jgi:hypothetical protein
MKTFLGNGIGVGMVQLGSNANTPQDPLYPWMELPYFFLPSNGLTITVGQDVTIYGEELINLPIDNNLVVTYSCNIGTQSGNNFTINPTAEQIGNHQLSITFKNGNRLITSRTISLTVIALAVRNVKILMVGDSTIANNANATIAAINSRFSGSTLTYIGTKGTTYKHEAIPGWTWGAFAANVASPFVKAGVLDIAAYFADNALADPDIVYFRLGVNESLAFCESSMSEAQKNQILAYIDLLVNAFLAYKSSIRVIIGLPTECENSGAAWTANYDPIRDQDLYIEIINRIRVAIVERYANKVYSARVDVSYDTIHLDRDEGYPKTDGVHTNAVHYSTLGYQQMGYGLAPYYNRAVADLNFNNQGLSVEWIDDFARLTWLDGDEYQTEIWELKNGDAYSLVATTAVGAGSYDSYTWQNANMSFKIRHLKDGVYSEFSDIVSINTPLVLKTNQSSLNTVTLNTITISAGKSVRVNWGDGTYADLSGTVSNTIKNYSTTGVYFISLTGDTNSITYLRMFTQVNIFGDLSKWIMPTSLVSIYLYSTSISGDLSSWILPTSCNSCYLYSTSVSGLPNIVAGSGAMNYQVYLTSVTSGNMTSFRKGMTNFSIRSQTLGFPISEVDEMFKNLADYYQANAPTANCTFNLSGTGMGIPTGGNSNSDIVRLKGYYTAAGFTATCTINT